MTDVDDDPETWDEDRLRDECAELSRELAAAEYYRDKYDRRCKAYVTAIAPLLRTNVVDDAREFVKIPYEVWDGFAMDLGAISYGRIPEPRS